MTRRRPRRDPVPPELQDAPQDPLGPEAERAARQRFFWADDARYWKRIRQQKVSRRNVDKPKKPG